jgi:hypothetical protein
MKVQRWLIVLASTVLFIVVAGMFFHTPVSFVDAITGATPRSTSRAESKAKAELSGTYLLCIHKRTDWADGPVGAAIVATARGNRTEPLPQAPTRKLRISVPADEPALIAYAEKLSAKLNALDIQARVSSYSEVMYISRALQGSYEVLLMPKDLMDSIGSVNGDGGPNGTIEDDTTIVSLPSAVMQALK